MDSDRSFSPRWASVRVSDASQLDEALAAAFAHDGPALVEVMTDAELV